MSEPRPTTPSGPLDGPMAGRRVLVTRAAHQASGLAGLLQQEGADVLLVPALEIMPPVSFCGLDAALSQLRSYDWLLLTSANAVEMFAARARRLGLSPVPRRVAAVGPATARAIERENIATRTDLIPSRYVSEGLLEALLPFAPRARMLLVRAEEARDVLTNGLRDAGAELTVAAAYRNVVPLESVRLLQEALRPGEPGLDAAAFTSASSVTNLARLLAAAGVALPQSCAFASIGPITSQALREAGWRVDIEAEEASLESLVRGLRSYFSR